MSGLFLRHRHETSLHPILVVAAALLTSCVASSVASLADGTGTPSTTPPPPAAAVPAPGSTAAPAQPTPKKTSLFTQFQLTTPEPAHGWIFDGDVDGRYRNASSGRTDESYLNEGEIDIGHPIYTNNTYRGNIFAQVIAENAPDASGGKGKYNDISLGEAYLTYRLPIATDTGSNAYLKLGQFILPVGLLPEYDTHLQILQTLAPLGIGERIDWGAEVEGRFNGIIDYKLAVTAGAGADHAAPDPRNVVSFRLGRLFATPYGVFNFGGSLLSGRLPVTEVDPLTGFPPVIPPSGRIHAIYGFVDKTRIVGDATWSERSITVRGEAMTGADGSTDVGGYFVMGEYRFAPGLSAIVSRTYWDYGRDNSTSGDNAIGMDIAYSNNLVLRGLYEEQREVPYLTGPETEPLASTHLRHIFTVQTVVRF